MSDRQILNHHQQQQQERFIRSNDRTSTNNNNSIIIDIPSTASTRIYNSIPLSIQQPRLVIQDDDDDYDEDEEEESEDNNFIQHRVSYYNVWKNTLHLISHDISILTSSLVQPQNESENPNEMENSNDDDEDNNDDDLVLSNVMNDIGTKPKPKRKPKSDKKRSVATTKNNNGTILVQNKVLYLQVVSSLLNLMSAILVVPKSPYNISTGLNNNNNNKGWEDWDNEDVQQQESLSMVLSRCICSLLAFSDTYFTVTSAFMDKNWNPSSLSIPQYQQIQNYAFLQQLLPSRQIPNREPSKDDNNQQQHNSNSNNKKSRDGIGHSNANSTTNNNSNDDAVNGINQDCTPFFLERNATISNYIVTYQNRSNNNVSVSESKSLDDNGMEWNIPIPILQHLFWPVRITDESIIYRKSLISSTNDSNNNNNNNNTTTTEEPSTGELLLSHYGMVQQSANNVWKCLYENYVLSEQYNNIDIEENNLVTPITTTKIQLIRSEDNEYDARTKQCRETSGPASDDANNKNNVTNGPSKTNSNIPYMSKFFAAINQKSTYDDQPIISLGTISRAIRLHFFGRDDTIDALYPQVENNNDYKNNGTDWNAVNRTTTTNYNTSDTAFTEHLHFGKLITEKQSRRFTEANNKKGIKSFSDRPFFESNPSRLYSTIHFLLLPQYISGKSSSSLPSNSASIFKELVPICYDLLSSSDDKTIGLGAAFLYRLLQSAFYNVSYEDDDMNLKRVLPMDIGSNLINVLYDTMKTCRVGSTLLLIGMTQQLLFRIIFQSTDDSTTTNHAYGPLASRAQWIEDCKQQRRLATQQWILLLDRNQQSTDASLILGLIIGGILPLLFDHCQDSNPMDALELGRPALAAILPMIRTNDLYFLGCNDASHSSLNKASSGYQSTSITSSVLQTSVRLAALATLSNILIAAHPIMKRHGGKIVCELLACIGHTKRSIISRPRGRRHTNVHGGKLIVPIELDELVEHKVLSLAQHVAVMALVMCGEAGMNVIREISNNKEYDNDFICIAKELQQKSINLKGEVLLSS